MSNSASLDRELSPVWRPATPLRRMGQVWGQLLRKASIAALRRVPGMSHFADHPTTQPLRSSHGRLLRWARSPYGTNEKPGALSEIPWDYVEKEADSIPFTGLREYWYPALKSAELHNNEPFPITMLDSNLVFFRDGKGNAVALENRCPHRGPLLSLGQVGVVSPGTITCRYHGMTFDGRGECTAVLTDGPDSPLCGRIRCKSYSVEEAGGIVWVYMGEKQAPPLVDSVPHLTEWLSEKSRFHIRHEWDINYLATLDNDVDLAHPSCAHRSCLPFSGQKLFGDIVVEDVVCGGVHAKFRDHLPHTSGQHVDSVHWHLPNFAYFCPGSVAAQPKDHTYIWAVPRDIGNTAYWILISRPKAGNPVTEWVGRIFGSFIAGLYWKWPGSPLSCVEGADRSMMQSQGRIARWDKDQLMRSDRPIVRARQMLKNAHRLELQERRARENAKRRDSKTVSKAR